MIAVEICATSAEAMRVFALRRASDNAGRDIAMSKPMIPSTTSISANVKPARLPRYNIIILSVVISPIRSKRVYLDKAFA